MQNLATNKTYFRALIEAEETFPKFSLDTPMTAVVAAHHAFAVARMKEVETIEALRATGLEAKSA